MDINFKIKHFNSRGERVKNNPFKKRMVVEEGGMKASYKGEIPWHHKYDGDVVQITNGCAGTTEYFLNYISDFPLNAILVTGTQCHSKIEITDTTFRVQVFKSKDPQSVIDDLTVHLDALPTGKFTMLVDFKWTTLKLVGLLLIIFASVGVFTALSRILVDKSNSKKGEYMMAEIKRTKRIESGHDPEYLTEENEEEVGGVFDNT